MSLDFSSLSPYPFSVIMFTWWGYHSTLTLEGTHTYTHTQMCVLNYKEVLTYIPLLQYCSWVGLTAGFVFAWGLGISPGTCLARLVRPHTTDHMSQTWLLSSEHDLEDLEQPACHSIIFTAYTSVSPSCCLQKIKRDGDKWPTCSRWSQSFKLKLQW